MEDGGLTQMLTSDGYTSFWYTMFVTIFSGFWSKFAAVILLILSFWYGVRKRNMRMASAFFVLTIIITYSGGIFTLAF